jgi:CheY-like chemotaxis protein
MFRSMFLAGCVLALAPALAPAQMNDDYRQFFKPPETAPEFWWALKFEIRQGKFAPAAEYLKGFIEKGPTDQELLDIEEKEGLSSFLRLRVISKWSDDPKITTQARENVEKVIDMVAAAQKKLLGDPGRIDKFVANLSATPEERSYAIRELRRSGLYGMPPLIKKLKSSVGTPDFGPLVGALPYLTPETVPAQLAALDIPEPLVQVGLIDALGQREDLLLLAREPKTNPIPSLAYLAAKEDAPELVRKKAANLLGRILNADPSRLPSARAELTRQAERYYFHKVKFVDPKAVDLWRWDGKDLVLETASASRAEQFYALRYAQQALDLEPASEAAQVLALSIAVDKAVEQGGLDKPLSSSSPAVKDLLATLNPDIVVAALERALADHRTTVILGTLRTLGELGEVKVARAKRSGTPALVQALNYPDRRVQFTAINTLLTLPLPPPPQASGRAVEILRRAMTADGPPRVIVADFNKDRGEEVANAVKAAGFDPVLLSTGHQVLRRLREAGDVDALLIDYQLPDPNLRDLIAGLRTNPDADGLRTNPDMGQLPIFITIPPQPNGVRPQESIAALQRMIDGYRNIEIVDASNDPDILKPMLMARITAAFGSPLTETERKDMAREAMVWLKRLALNEIAGYDVRPAQSAIFNVLRSDEFGLLAVQAVARLAGRQPQRELAALVLDNMAKPELRVAGAIELSHHIQQNGLVLSRAQSEGLTDLYHKTEDARLRAGLAQVIGASRPDAYRTGDKLRSFVAPPVGPAPAAEEKPKEKEKEKEEK